MTTPKVSVIIPTYNRAQCVGRAIDSVLRQTYADHEIIVIDDGSTDNTKDVLSKYNGRIKYVYQPNGGISHARNHGIRVSTGEYIAFLDSDDEWVPEKLDIQVALLERNKKLGIVCSKMIILDENGRECGMKPEGRTGRNFKELIEIGGDLPTSSVMTRRECFDKVGMFDESLPMMEDFEMWVRIASRYDIDIFTTKVLAYYHKHADQITKNMTLVYESTIKLQEKILHNFEHTPGFAKEIVKHRIAFNQYTLSRIYYNDRRYKEAFRLLRAVMGQHPLVGTQFFERDEPVSLKAVKIIKPYGYFVVCLTRLIHGDKLKPGHDLENIKVAFIHEHGQNFVGQERSLMERLLGLRELGIQCEVLLPGGGQFCDLLKAKGFTVRSYSLHHLAQGNPFPYFKTVWEVFRLIKNNQYSIVHCSGAYPNQYALPAAKLSGIPCVVHINTTIYSKEFLKKCFVRFADRVITVSEGSRQSILKHTSIPRDKVQTIYNGIGNGHILGYLNSGRQLKKDLHLAESTKIVGQIGSLVPRKGCEHFIEMAKIVKEAYPDVKFFIVGPAVEEDYERRLKEKIADLNLKEDVILANFQANPYPFIDMFDVSVLASNAEGLGRIIVESQKMGKPVVSTNIPGVNEAISDRSTGLLVPPRDPKALADAVLELLNNPQEARKLAQEGQKIALEKFDEKKHARSVYEVYQNLLRG